LVTAKELTTIPAIYQKVKEYELGDSRFVQMRIWLMHTGENHNGSYFTKEAVESAIPSLANTPVIAYVEENSDGEIDFSDHRMVLHRSEDGEFKLKYMGVAIGIIPETNNAHWEKRVTDDGVEREYLVVDALIWTKWEDTIEILNGKNGKTSQSMELSDDFTGYIDNDGLFHFESFQFNGACLLGEDYLPAMEGSTGEVYFNKDIHKNIEEKLQEFYTLFSKENSQEGGKTVEKDNKKVEDVKEQEEKQVENAQVNDMEETPAVKEQTDETPVKEEDEPKKEHSVDEPKEEPKKEEPAEPVKEEQPLPEEQKPHSDEQEEKQEPVVIEEEAPKEDKPDFEQKHNDLQTEFDKLQEEVHKLRDFKRNAEESEIREKFKGQVSEEEFTQVFESMKDAETSDIEDKLFAIVGRKNYSIKNVDKKEANKVVFSHEKNDEAPFAGLLKGFEKKF
jgi:hypothetical protein